MNFDIFGPFDIQKRNSPINANNVRKILREEFATVDERLQSACGCYLVVNKAGGGYRPMYVGLTKSLNFLKECSTDHKIAIYLTIASQKDKGTIKIFLIPKQTARGKFCKPKKKRDKTLHFLESLLIGRCLEKNENLLNIQKTKEIKNMVVPGFLNSPKGQPTTPTREFKKAIG